MRVKIGKKLKTASRNLKFTDSYQKRVNTLCTYYFNFDCRQQRYTNLYILGWSEKELFFEIEKSVVLKS